MSDGLRYEIPQAELEEALDALHRCYDLLVDNGVGETSDAGWLLAAICLVQDLQE